MLPALPLAAVTAGTTAAKGTLLTKLAGPIAGLAGNLIGGLFGKSGQEKANQANLQIAREQMQFQERMSNTAYQRAAKDLQAAGLNRVLALGSPATTPAGARATMQNENALLAAGIQGGVSTAFDAMRLRNETALNRAQIRNIDAQTSYTRAQTGTEGHRSTLVMRQAYSEKLRAAGIETDNQIKLLNKQAAEYNLEGAKSGYEFYKTLMSKPEANVQYHLGKIFSDSKYGMLQKLLIQSLLYEKEYTMPNLDRTDRNTIIDKGLNYEMPGTM